MFDCRSALKRRPSKSNTTTLLLHRALCYAVSFPVCSFRRDDVESNRTNPTQSLRVGVRSVSAPVSGRDEDGVVRGSRHAVVATRLRFRVRQLRSAVVSEAWSTSRTREKSHTTHDNDIIRVWACNRKTQSPQNTYSLPRKTAATPPRRAR